MLRSIGLTFSLFLVVLGPACADERKGSAQEALKALLADIEAGSDEAFDAYKERAKLTSETVAPKGLRPFLEREDIEFGEMKAEIACGDRELNVGWKVEAAVDGGIDEVEKLVLSGLKSVGLELNAELPADRNDEKRLRMMQVISQRVVSLTRQTGTAQEFIVLGLADRNAIPGSHVRIQLHWTASAPFDGPRLTLQEAIDNLPMLKNVPVEPEVLKVAMVAVLGRFETNLQDTQKRTQGSPRPMFADDIWILSTTTDFRPDFHQAMDAAGYVLAPERRPARDGHDSKTWRNGTGRRVSCSFLARQNMLLLQAHPPLRTLERPK